MEIRVNMITSVYPKIKSANKSSLSSKSFFSDVFVAVCHFSVNQTPPEY